MTPPVETSDLLNAAEAATVLGLSHRQAIATYRARYEDFPEPVIWKGKCVLWNRSDLLTWQQSRKG